MGNITFVGSEGSGKTVLLSVLAHGHQQRVKGKVWFDPTGRTLKHVGLVMETLQSGDWPASTVTGARDDLRWNVTLVNGVQICLQAFDCAGQDLRRLFNGGDAPAELQPFFVSVQGSQLIFFLLNLNDFIGRPESERLDYEVMLKDAMDKLCSSGRSCALVLTQIDRYRYLEKKHDSWENTVKAVAPTVYAAHLERGTVPLFAVAAVGQTVSKFDPDTNSAQTFPAPEFTSEGLDQLVCWMGKALTPPPPPTFWENNCGIIKKIAIAASILVALILLLTTIFSGGPKIVVVPCQICNGSGKIEYWVMFNKKCDTCQGKGTITVEIPR